MAYSRIVVTESNLAECLRQLALRLKLTVPRTIRNAEVAQCTVWVNRYVVVTDS